MRQRLRVLPAVALEGVARGRRVERAEGLDRLGRQDAVRAGVLEQGVEALDRPLVPLAGRRLVFQPFAFSALANVGKWDEAPLLESLRRGELGLLLLFQSSEWAVLQTRWTPAMLEVIQEYYALDEELARTLVARPGLRTQRYRARHSKEGG